MTEKQQKTVKIIIACFCLVFLALITIFIGRPLVNYISKPEAFRNMVAQSGIKARLLFFAMTFLQTIIALIPGEPFEIAAGYAFGTLEGTILCILSSGIASMVVFTLVKHYGMKVVELFFDKDKIQKLSFIKDSKKRDVLLMLVFMIPGTPKDLLSYFAGLTNVSYPVWFLICTLGRIPSVITSVIGGNALGTKSYWFAIIVFASTMLISLLGILIYNRVCDKKNKEQEKKEEVENTNNEIKD